MSADAPITMSKHDKVLIRIQAKPPACDIKWSDLKALLEHLGYEQLNGSGSRRKFFHKEKNALIVCHEPHPRSEVDKGCVADVCQHLRDKGFI